MLQLFFHCSILRTQIDDNAATVASAKIITVPATDVTSLSDNHYDTTIAACKQHTDISNTSSLISHTLLPASCPEITVALTTDVVGNAKKAFLKVQSIEEMKIHFLLIIYR